MQKLVSAWLAVAAGVIGVLLGAASAEAGSIDGAATFWGERGGPHTLYVCAFTSFPASGPAIACDDVTTPATAYQLLNLDGTYYVSAFIDFNESGSPPPDPYELEVWHDGNGDGTADAIMVTAGGAVTGKNIDLGYMYVDADAAGVNDGTSWANAYTDLTAAISAAPSGLQVLVAEGTYKPGGASPTRSSSFSLKNGVRIFGGFSGIDDQRHEIVFPTILSGDIGTEGSPADNVYHVVSALNPINDSAVLDGFTVTGGRADVAPNDKGGGLYAVAAGPTIVNIVFSDNRAYAGGGVFNQGGPIRIVNSLFVGNHAVTEGGGFYGAKNSETIVNSVFSGNSAFRGGGIAIDGGSSKPTLVNVTVAGNTTDDEGVGGGLFNRQKVSDAGLDVRNSIFWGNANGQIVTWLSVPPSVLPSVTYSIVQGGYGVPTDMNLADDPDFVDPDGADGLVGTPDDDLSLELTSPAIDSGDNTAVPTDAGDLDGDGDAGETLPLDKNLWDRFYDVVGMADSVNGTEAIVDRGAYETQEAVPVDISIEKNDLVDEVAPGSTVSYWAEVWNDWREPVTGVIVSDPFPPGLSDCSWCYLDADEAYCSGGSTGDLNDVIDLPFGASVFYTATCTLAHDATGTLSNTMTASVPSEYRDTRLFNNSSTDEDSLVALGGCGVAPDIIDILDYRFSGHGVLVTACNSISAEFVEIFGSVKFQAGQTISLHDGFAVFAGAQFEAEIETP